MSAFDSFDLYNILFIDIETAPVVADFEELSDEMQELWGIKCRNILRKPEEEIEFESEVAARIETGINGRSMVKTAPDPRPPLVALMSPECSSTSMREMARPRPRPPNT